MLIRGWLFGVVLAVGAAGVAAGEPVGAGASVEGAPAAGSVSVVGSAVAAPVTSVSGVLRSLASRSGVVFVGQVQSIIPKGGVVEITFQVQQAVVGNVGAGYVLREWAGRWTGGRQQYRVGERAMFFLRTPSAAGLSSPVDGMAGVVPLVLSGASAGTMLDVRWLATRVVRAAGSPLAGAETGAMSLADATAVVRGGQQTTAALPEPVLYPLPGVVHPRPVVERVPSTLESPEVADVQR